MDATIKGNVTVQQPFAPQVDWWVYAVVIFTVAICCAGLLLEGEWLIGIILAFLLCLIEILIFCSVKYQIKADQLGVRNLFYHWDWFPISQIASRIPIKKYDPVLNINPFHTLSPPMLRR